MTKPKNKKKSPTSPTTAKNNNNNLSNKIHSKKMVIVGDGVCGKTCLSSVMLENKFPEIYTPTVFENKMKDLVIDNKHVELTVWDTAGQDDYEKIRPLAYVDVDIILLCYSIDNPASLKNIKEIWIPEITHYCPKSIWLLIGNKKDLRNDEITIHEMKNMNPSQKPVSYQEGKKVAKDIHAYEYLECSSLLNDGVEEILETAIRAGFLNEELQRKFREKNKGCCEIM